MSAPLAKLVGGLPFVAAHDIEVLEIGDGKSVVRMPFAERFSTPPNAFPASMVGLLGDVAAISAFTSLVFPEGFCSTMDFTVKMTAIAAGEALEAEGSVLQSGKTVTVGEAKVYTMNGSDRQLCAVVLATGRVIRNN